MTGRDEQIAERTKRRKRVLLTRVPDDKQLEQVVIVLGSHSYARSAQLSSAPPPPPFCHALSFLPSFLPEGFSNLHHSHTSQWETGSVSDLHWGSLAHNSAKPRNLSFGFPRSAKPFKCRLVWSANAYMRCEDTILFFTEGRRGWGGWAGCSSKI